MGTVDVYSNIVSEIRDKVTWRRWYWSNTERETVEVAKLKEEGNAKLFSRRLSVGHPLHFTTIAKIHYYIWRGLIKDPDFLHGIIPKWDPTREKLKSTAKECMSMLKKRISEFKLQGHFVGGKRLVKKIQGNLNYSHRLDNIHRLVFHENQLMGKTIVTSMMFHYDDVPSSRLLSQLAYLVEIIVDKNLFEDYTKELLK